MECGPRGLRQGDPLSPFLFLLVAETLSRLVAKGKEIGALSGVLVGKDQIPVTHLQFADDTIIFAPADRAVISNYKKLLKCFALMSGLQINYRKSVLIPLGCDDDWIEEAVTIMKCETANLPISYLGIPLGACPGRFETWKPIIGKVEKRLSLWKAKCLSKAGRLVLIKSVLNNLPIYYLSLFRMPKKVARRIIQVQRCFFWGKKVGDKGGNLIAWDVIQRPINRGGLGVGDIHTRNAALLFKWWWRFADDQKSLWKEIIKSNHNLNHIEDFQGLNKRSSSSIWGQIIDFSFFNKKIQEVACKGIQMRVGNGTRTRFWLDHWTGGQSLKDTFPRLYVVSTQKNRYIDDMGVWENGCWSWSFKWRRNLFAWEVDLVEQLSEAVNRTSLRENRRDVRVWSFDNSNSFSVSNFYLQATYAQNEETPIGTQGQLAWRNVAPPKAQLQVWFILQKRLNTKDRLVKIGVLGVHEDRCALCKEEPESVEHIIFCCRFSSSLWYYCHRRWNLSTCIPKDPTSCLLSWMGGPFRNLEKRIWIALFYVTAWSIWDLRNRTVFQGCVHNLEIEKKLIFWRLGDWITGWCTNFPFSPGQMHDELSCVREWARDMKTQRARKAELERPGYKLGPGI